MTAQKQKIEWTRLAELAFQLPRWKPAGRWLFLGHDSPIGLQDALARFVQMERGHPRDHIYGLLGHVREEQRPAVDYSKSSIEVFADTISLLSTHAWQAAAETESDSSLVALR